MKWINLKDERPPRMTDILVTYEGKIFMAWDECLQPEEDVSLCCFDRTFEEEKVTHWSALPKGPS